MYTVYTRNLHLFFFLKFCDNMFKKIAFDAFFQWEPLSFSIFGLQPLAVFTVKLQQMAATNTGVNLAAANVAAICICGKCCYSIANAAICIKPISMGEKSG